MVEKVWYFTDLPFQDHPSLQGSNHWLDITERGNLVGEQWFDPPWPERPRTIDGLAGDHECGEESDFEEGQPWPYEGAPIEYDDDDIPLCCPRARALKGGLEIGGEVGDVFTSQPFGNTCCNAPVSELARTYSRTITYAHSILEWWRWEIPAGQYTLSALATGISDSLAVLHYGASCEAAGGFIGSSFMHEPYTFVMPESGTLCVIVEGSNFTPGAAGYVIRLDEGAGGWFTDPTEGGIQVGGEVGESGANIDPAEGGAQVGGEVGDVSGAADAASGGMGLGGSVGSEAGGTDALAGGGELGGSAGDVPSAADAAAGGGELGGEVGDVSGAADAASGGMGLGGSAGDAPGTTDALAGGGELGGSAGDVPSAADAAAGGGELGGEVGDSMNTMLAPRGVSNGATATGVYNLPTRFAGDFLVAFVCHSGAPPTPNVGWTVRDSTATNDTGTKAFARVLTRTSDGTDSRPCTDAAATYVIFSFAGGAAGLAANHNASGTQTGLCIATSVTMGAPGIMFSCYLSQTAWGGTTWPSGVTMTVNTTGTPRLAAGWCFVPAGATGTRTANLGTALWNANLTLGVW